MIRRLLATAFVLGLALGALSGSSPAQTEPPEPVFNCSNIASGTNGPDDFPGTAANDCWNGLGGNDNAVGFGGHDRFDLGSGDDNACGGNCSGGGGDLQDVLRGASGIDQLFGDGGNDFIYGGSGRDLLEGDDGDDTLAACDGQADTVKGNGGFNTAYLDRNLDTWTGIDEKHFC